MSEQDAASKLAAIESMKEKLKSESETLKALRAQLKHVIAQQQSEKAVPSLAQTAGQCSACMCVTVALVASFFSIRDSFTNQNIHRATYGSNNRREGDCGKTGAKSVDNVSQAAYRGRAR